jgi:B-cell receptor-associated protein 31
VKRVLITLFVFVALLFVDTARSIANADKLEMSNPLDRVTLFRNQRNLYLTGIVLFLLLVLYRFQSLLNDLFAAEQKAGAVASQAKNSGAGLDAIVNERDKLAATVVKLEARLADLESADKAIAALKKQAENQKNEYLRVLEENKRLLDENTKKSKEAKKGD